VDIGVKIQELKIAFKSDHNYFYKFYFTVGKTMTVIQTHGYKHCYLFWRQIKFNAVMCL